MITLISLLDVGYFPEVKLLSAKGVPVGRIEVLPSPTGKVQVSEGGIRIVKSNRTLFLLVSRPVDKVILKVPRGINLEMATLKSDVEVRDVSLEAMDINDVAGNLRLRGGKFGSLSLNLVDDSLLMVGCDVGRATVGAMGSRITVKGSRIGSLDITATEGKMAIERSTVGKVKKSLRDFKIVWR